ncbi:MAG: NADH-quinone oxidoreductase subunit H [Candidatus Thermoplasmatota archaeon]|nr:NADH-quinone oxidoreductase subunit H [Candidatus Thermoplasmatota archaeon]
MNFQPSILFSILLSIAAPFIGMLILGFDRKITARMQNRVGPPILQPFYDVVKLFGKSELMVKKAQILFALMFVGTLLLSTVLLCFGGDLLVIFFLISTGMIFYTLGAYSVKSGFSFIGGNRELYQMLAYEPIFMLTVFSVGLITKSFRVDQIFGLEVPLVAIIPLPLVSMMIVFLIKMQKSPFDISTAHTEIISGPMIEYSGGYLALLKIAHWYEIFLVIGIMSLFFVVPGNPVLTVVSMAAAGLAIYFVSIIIDNVTARVHWNTMLRLSAAIGITLIVVNVAIVYIVAYIAGGA